MSGRSILLVADHAGDAGLTGDDVVVLGADAALELLFGASARALPSVIVIDVPLAAPEPGELVGRIRADERTAFIPVVILSSSVDQDDIHRCYRMGANSYLRKPAERAAMPEVAQMIKRYWLTLNEPAHWHPKR